MAASALVAVLGVVGVPHAGAATAAAAESTPDPLFDDEASDETPGFPDPFQPVNRAMFAFNRQFDRWVISPVTKVYRFAVPAPGRRAIRRAFVNLDAPVTFANDVLQLEPTDALVTLTRFVVNTTVGIVGLFDVAASLNLEGHESDFGQTLALSGVPSGPYLIFPLLGPTTARDGFGFIIDFAFRPTSYILTPGGAFFITAFSQTGPELLVTTLFEGSTELAEGLATREAAGDALEALEASSIDYYAALKNAFYQNRVAAIWRRGPDRGPQARARSLLAGLSLGPSRGEVVDLGTHGRDEPVKPLALEY